MAEFNEIRDNFIQELDNWFKTANAYITITKGVRYEADDKEKEADLKVKFLSIKESGDGSSSAVTEGINIKQALEIVSKDKDAIEKLFFSRAIQIWYDFLNRILESLVDSHLSGKKSYPKLNKIKQVNIDFKQINPDNFREQIILAIKDSFDFSKGLEKLQPLEKALEIKIPQNEKYQIKKFIIVRNLIEHNQGQIRETDLNEMGVNIIKLYDQWGKEQEYKLNDKVEIGLDELRKVKEVFEKVANILIPKSS
ncbi:hypothetical protein PCC7424_1438 [Gloeothece citriformis PCC 7424]|uniref:RiboL-PSP-HEPN domain-containing protein n=1 Tax=Gloeothece citriformis (strain PCC 7424) TaxID=65393 RepID=B7K8C1_GLOC7|nr:hypothetical protein [Gloeothece citriformis]ACK69881.1 hypothetical protein PCC7424_1438 [Gloeothece citriformis PCC 7424]